MAKRDEISSTEKLLNVIRGKAGKPAELPQEKPVRAAPKSSPKGIIKALPFKRKLTVGLDIDLHEMKLAAVEGIGDKPQLVDYIRIPYEPEINKDSLQFPRFLKSALADFWAGSTCQSIAIEIGFIGATSS